MTLNKEILTKVIKQAKKAKKEWEKLSDLLKPIGWNEVTPTSLYFQTELIPEIKMIMGGDLILYRSLFNETRYEAQLTIDGIQFRNYFIEEGDKERYERLQDNVCGK